MRKALAICVIATNTMFIFSMIFPFSLAIEFHQVTQHNDVEIDIYAGVYEKTDGNIGLGWVISIYNNYNEDINGTYEIKWDTLSGKNIRIENGEFNISPQPPVKFYGIDYLHFPYPVLRITFIVVTMGIESSRSGIEIGPFVIFPQ